MAQFYPQSALVECAFYLCRLPQQHQKVLCGSAGSRLAGRKSSTFLRVPAKWWRTTRAGHPSAGVVWGGEGWEWDESREGMEQVGASGEDWGRFGNTH